ncbi:Putative magnesium transporter NIPA [Septoria linicola]|uniref:Magnesium transporter NIPA n=1 Tax=Septoria linicola TaxID=215465 RepID=A0A9Q9EFM0_9PEZI|nr:putative magnesium transporter NIPA [Septoria linicola]USW49906.1 Putative magnesium transporter NIPA [Septoria linicola]
MIEDKYIGLALAVTSTLGIGASFVITKKGLNAAAQKHGFEGDGFAYLRNPIWWGGIITMVIGEICNFSAYAFAPAILVTPLGALSVLIGAVLGSYFLDERLGVLGRVGCAICLIGSVVIVLHAPPDQELKNIDELLHYAMQLGFLTYCTIVTIFALVMIYKIAPLYGKKNPMVYISICSTVGSISIMAIKGFGIALKLTLGGNNQFTHPSTYVFAIVVVVCILTQMNYFNKALATYSTNIVNPLYYVTFTTCTLTASFIMFRGFNTSDAVNTISLLCGFLTIFTGVYLLNLSREDPDGMNAGIKSAQDGRGEYHDVDGIPTDGLTGLQTRLSMQSRRSGEHRRSNSWSLRSPQNGRRAGSGDYGSAAARGEQQHMLHSYDIEANTLGDLAEDSDEDTTNGSNQKRTSFDNGRSSGATGLFNAPRRTGTENVNMASGKGFDPKR